MKYFIVTDVHGFYNEMKSALDRNGFDPTNPNHIFVSLGDAFDRGTQPREVLQFMMDLPEDRRILIRGNHEDLMETAIIRRAFKKHDITNGTKATAQVLTGKTNEPDALIEMRTHPLYNQYIASCVNYHETTRAIFVHGWIPHNCQQKGVTAPTYIRSYSARWRDADKYQWEMARWCNGMDAWDQGVIEPNKTIFCGHYYAAWARAYIDHTCSSRNWVLRDFTPWANKGIVALDACTAATGFVNCVTIEDEPLSGMMK